MLKITKRKSFIGLNLLLLFATGNVWAQFPGFGGGGMPPFGGGFGYFGRFHSFGPDVSPNSQNNQPFGFGMENEQGNSVEFTSSNLPIIIIDTDGGRINADKKITAKMQIIDNGNNKRNNITDSPNDYNGFIEIKLRGNSSLSFEQKRYTLETVGEDGKKFDTPLLGMPADNDWVLLSPYNDISMMRDVFAFDLWNKMGYWAPRTRYAELIVDGDYRGVYILTEKIKRSKDRLDIANLKEIDNEGLELTGGYIMRIDAYDAEDLTFISKVPGISSVPSMGGGGFMSFGGGMNMTMGGSSMNNVVWSYYSPKKSKITTEQANYIHNYIDETELAIQGENFKDPENGYAKYIKISSFVDYFIHTELSLNADGFKRSAYFYKTKQNEDGSGGKLHAGPVWDYNLAYGNCNFCNADQIDAWVHEGGETNPTPAMWKRLTEDPAFMDRVKKRWKELRQDILSIERINSFIDSNAKLLAEVQERQYEKYDDLLVPENSNTQHQNGMMGGFGGMMGGPSAMMGMGGNSISWFAAYRVSSYEEEIETLKKWFAARIEFLDSQWQ